jgi:hypothetical protein
VDTTHADWLFTGASFQNTSADAGRVILEDGEDMKRIIRNSDNGSAAGPAPFFLVTGRCGQANTGLGGNRHSKGQRNDHPRCAQAIEEREVKTESRALPEVSGKEAPVKSQSSCVVSSLHTCLLAACPLPARMHSCCHSSNC